MAKIIFWLLFNSTFLLFNIFHVANNLDDFSRFMLHGFGALIALISLCLYLFLLLKHLEKMGDRI